MKPLHTCMIDPNLFGGTFAGPTFEAWRTVASVAELRFNKTYRQANKIMPKGLRGEPRPMRVEERNVEELPR